MIFGSFGELWESITYKRYDAEKRSPSKGTSFACPLKNNINPIVQNVSAAPYPQETEGTPTLPIAAMGRSD